MMTLAAAESSDAMVSLLPLFAAALLCMVSTPSPAAASNAGLVCAAPVPHTAQCYAGTNPLGKRDWRGMADCCEACQNITAPVPCAIWVSKGSKCILLPASARPRSGTGCTSGSSVPPPPHPGPHPPPQPPSPSPPSPAADPLNPKLPPNRWGPFVGRKSELAPEYGFVSGLGMGCDWGVVEAVQGTFNFSACESVVQAALKANMYIVLNPSTGPAAPLGWLAKAGVPTVRVCFKISQKNPGQNCTPELADRAYPYYLAPAYLPLWTKYQRALHDWLKQLPKNKQGYRPVQSVQVSLGSTGDVTPWHGQPLESKYQIGRDVWQEFWVNGSRIMWEIHRDLLPDTKLLFNGVPSNSTPEPDNPDAKYWPAYRSLVFDEIAPPNFDLKNGVVSHEYMTTNELDDYDVAGNITRWPYVNAATGVTEFVRTRGESSDGGLTGPGAGFWKNPTWNLLAMMCWDVTYGLDVQNPNPQIWSQELGQRGCHNSSQCSNWTKILWRPFQHFHTHAGAKVAATAPGAWLQLRDALDYADGARFPVARYGPRLQSNTQRLRKIVAEFAHMGARAEDVAAATASRHKSRARVGINNVGWRIWPHNYGKWMAQLDPMATSVGRWCVGEPSNLLGQNTRQTLPGKSMSFALAPGLFAGPDAGTAQAAAEKRLHVRVGFFDEGHGSWELHYASSSGGGSLTVGGGGRKLAAHVQKNDTRKFVEVRLVLLDLELQGLTHQRHGGGSSSSSSGVMMGHFELVDTDATRSTGTAAAVGTGGGDGEWKSSDPDTFAWIEVLATPFLYQMAEVVRDLGTVA